MKNAGPLTFLKRFYQEAPVRSGSRYEVYTVHFASRRARSWELFLNEHLYGEPERALDLEYFFWVIRGEERIVLVDTGFTRDVAAMRHRDFHRSVESALEDLDLRAADVTDIIITHAHWDHTGNLGLFPQAQVYIAAPEYDFWRSPYAERTQVAHAAHQPDIELLSSIAEEGRLHRVPAKHTLVPGIAMCTVGGHTPGQLVVSVHGVKNPVLLTSDAVHLLEEIDADRPFAVLTDLLRMYDAYDLIDELRASVQDLAVVPGHDPQVFDGFARVNSADTVAGTYRVG